MGDGRVALILDVLGLAQRARVVAEAHDRGRVETTAQSKESSQGAQSLLLLRGPDDGRMAIPLALVARLEEFERTKVERMGNQSVVQYRGQILPLVRISGVLPERRKRRRNPKMAEEQERAEKIQVVVYSNHGKSVGLVVDRILDIVDAKPVDQSGKGREGTLGSVVIQGRVTELLDVEATILAAIPSFLEGAVA